MKCLYPVMAKDKSTGKPYTFPCGHCIPCKINKSLDWLIRLEYENMCHKDSAFVTLTYNDEHLPDNNSLVKADFQKFMKLLRANSDNKYMYYAVGEYGEAQKKYMSDGADEPHGRPHYHAIIYGLKPDCDDSRELVYKSWKKCNPEQILNPIFNAVGTVTHDSMIYVCDYMQKKQYGLNGDKLYGTAQPPFSLCSQRLGLTGFQDDDIYNILHNGYIIYNGIKHPIPRYFRNKYDIKSVFTISEDDVYKKYALEKGLVKYEDVDFYDSISASKQYNAYYFDIIAQQPQHIEEVRKLLQIRNNLRGDKL